MSLRIVIDPVALASLRGYATRIAGRNLDAALRFEEAAHETFRLLAASPNVGSLRNSRLPGLEGVRTWPVKGFRFYRILYRPTETELQVLDVYRTSRDIRRLARMRFGRKNRG